MPFEEFEEIPTPSEEEKIGEEKTEKGKEKANIEELIVEDWEREEIEKIKEFNEEYEKEYIMFMRDKYGLELEGDGRVDIDSFRDKEGYSLAMVENAKRRVERLEYEWYGFKKSSEAEREKKVGELLERFTTLVLHENLKEDFIVYRATRYDDYVNHVDQILIDKETGHAVCALDEKAPKTKEWYKRKKEEILDRNLKGGAKINFGYKFEKGKLTPSRLRNIPILCLPLDEETLKEAINDFEKRKDVFQHYISTALEAISELQQKRHSMQYKILTKDFKAALGMAESRFRKYAFEAKT